jgi:hypothetical protein
MATSFLSVLREESRMQMCNIVLKIQRLKLEKEGF